MRNGTAAAVLALAAMMAGEASAADRPPLCDNVGGDTWTGNMISRETVRFPVVGEVSKAEVGQSMVDTAQYSVYGNQIELLEPIAFDGPPAEFYKRLKPKKLNPDQRFKATVPVGWYGQRPALTVYNKVPGYVVAGLKPTAVDGRLYDRGVVALEPAGPDKLTMVFSIDRGLWKSAPISVRFRQGTCADWTPGDFKRELVYSGLSGGTISVTYREFADNFARPAFTQELRYDLSEGKEVGFRGARFEVIKATNTEITYRVLRPLE